MGKNSSKTVLSLIIFLSLSIMLLKVEMVMGRKTRSVPVNIGAIFDFEDEWVGKIGLSCINMSLSDFKDIHPHFKSNFLLHTKDIRTDSTVLAATTAMELINDKKVEAIFIGPATSAQTKFIIELGEKTQVPIISFSESSFSLNSYWSPYLFKATRSDTNNQAKVISSLIQSFKWSEAVPIYVDNEYGQGVIPYLTDAFQDLGISAPYWTPISPSATNDQIREKLEKLNAMSTRVFVVHMFPDLGSRIFTIAKEIGMMKEGYVWILTDGMTNFLHSLDPSVIDSMQGVLGVKPYFPRTKMLKNFEIRWKVKFYQDHQDMVNAGMNIYGLLAYDATMALANAFEKTRNGPTLIQALSNISFKGLTGDFVFVNQKLQSSDFQVVNLDSDDAVKVVGCWTPNSTDNFRCNCKSTSTVMWPGYSMKVPRGWDIPIKGKKLRVVVPVKKGFKQFVNATRIPNSDNYYNVTGFSIDLFKAAMNLVPHAPDVEYIPLDGNYTHLVEEVSNEKYAAMVGDVTLTGDRSKLIDFTLPYINSGVLVILRTEERMSEKAWDFLKPLTWKLWVTTMCFFIYIAFVVWVLEHRINEEFQGSRSSQCGTSFWFSFSTMAFAHRERLVSNLSKVVVIIWCFVGLVLTQSYTAGLTTNLTVKNLQTRDLDIQELMKQNVGYQKGSFVQGILESLDFHKIVPYDSAEQCHKLLSNRNKSSSIVVAFEELPYAKLILAQSCGNYMTIDPSKLKGPYWKNISNLQKFKTDGIGFVFPKGSRLAPLISSVILELMDTPKFKEIEDYWFGNLSSCDSYSNDSVTLDLGNFWVLFLIAGIVSFSALMIYTSMFVYQYKDVVMPSDSGTSVWKAIRHLLQIFNQIENASGKNVMDGIEHDANDIPDTGATGNAPTGSIPLKSPADQPGEPSAPKQSDLNSNGETPIYAASKIEHTNPTEEHLVK